jgi:hypothetical protein
VRQTTAPVALAPVLERVHADLAAYYGLQRPRFVPLNYQDRPFSHVLRLAVHDDGHAAPSRNVFVKVTKPKVIPGGPHALRDRVSRDFDTTRRAHAAMRDGDLGVVPPIACYPDLLAMVTEEVVGPTLLQYLHGRASWAVGPERLADLGATMSRAGRWLRAFQETASGGLVNASSFRDYIDHRLHRLLRSRGGGLSPSVRAHILQHVDRLAAAIDPADLAEVAIHSDLALGNVLVSDGRIVVLDFAMAKLGTRLHDLTRLWVQLDVLTTKPRFRPSTVRHLQSALLAGYDPSVTPEQPLFRLLVLLHRVNQLAKLSSSASALAPYTWIVRWHHRRRLAQDLLTSPDGK